MSPKANFYVDGFILTVPQKRLQEYKRMARQAGKVWREHGALEFRECMGDDLNVKGMLPFPKMAKARPGEVVFFSYIVYKTKTHRKQVNSKVMKDPRLAKMMSSKNLPFDVKKMAYGGFKAVIDL